MLLKKPTTTLCRSAAGVLFAIPPPTTITTRSTPCQPYERGAKGPCLGRSRQCRSYASVHDGKRGQSEESDAGDQPRWPTSANPTPYEILGIARDAPYSKARYFQLAKLYHPDRRHHTSDDGVPHATKLERYRLVVAAHEILSNPQKKRMYDLYGLGWGVETESQTRHRAADRSWRQEPGNPSMNATWEDWERWHQERNGSGEKQEHIFTSNLAFMAIVSAFLIVGTWGQVTRAGTSSVTLIEMRDQNHAAISKELRQRQSRRAGLDREGRVESFLRQRELDRWAYDPPGHGVQAPGDNGTPERLQR
ncbi:hypothetical protein C8A03DRAFT_18186 [Achaetomium macrosporum]|uniref:J domain-containing protein n=1 Tax=Achaetomium macrosporum TaxID=79813 RepID=A0AAN7C4R9_9PEZI|nr:hypothetical protein C8A03DRAFT_18186 [Achaetomium macrosporum]